MKRFLLGLAVGATAVYVASKLIDDETRKEILEEWDEVADKAKDAVHCGRRRALRMGVHARHEYRKGKKKLSRAAGDFADRLSEDLSDREERLREKFSEE